MNSNTVPTEILVIIFKLLSKTQLKTCLLVNKAWNKVAETFFDPEIHLQLYHKHREYLSKETWRWRKKDTRGMYKDLLKFPKFAAKVIKITAVTPKIHRWIPTLNLCSNVSIIHIECTKPWELLQELEASQVQLPKLQKLDVYSHWGEDGYTRYLWPCLWKFRSSITILPNLQPSRHDMSRFANDTLTFLSQFPCLESCSLHDTSIDLYGLLAACRNLKDIRIKKSTLTFDGDDWSNLPTTIEKLYIASCTSIPFNALRFLAQTSCSLNKAEVQDITLITNYDQQEIRNIFGHFPTIPKKFKKRYIKR